MTDRELLELAAKAAGWSAWDWLASDEYLNVYSADGRHDTFAPLTDDGDALRLAVKLGMNLFLQNDQRACVLLPSCSEVQPKGADPYAATRRAIVRAAAELGKSVEQKPAPE